MGQNRMINKFTISYTVFDTTGTRIPKPLHLKYGFEGEGDILWALDEGGCAILENLITKYGWGEPGSGVELILRGITHDNAQEFYQTIINQEKK